jgi:hypothetical protein
MLIVVLVHDIYFLQFYVFFYNKLQMFLTHHVYYISFICGEGLSKF